MRVGSRFTPYVDIVQVSLGQLTQGRSSSNMAGARIETEGCKVLVRCWQAVAAYTVQCQVILHRVDS